MVMEYNLGRYKEKTVIESTISFPEKVIGAIGSCGCTSVSYKENEIRFKWKLPEFPFQIPSNEFNVGITIDVWLESGKKLTESFKATIER